VALVLVSIRSVAALGRPRERARLERQADAAAVATVLWSVDLVALRRMLGNLRRQVADDDHALTADGGLGTR
jgi:hypothetical protein